MGQSIGLFRHSGKEAAHALGEWAWEHMLAAVVDLVAAFLGLPAALLLSGVTLETLHQELVQIAAYSLIGPVLLIGVAYFYFLLRAPTKLYAARVDELRDLRVVLGMPIEDLEEAEQKPGSLPQWLNLYSFRILMAAFFAACIIGGAAIGAFYAEHQGFNQVVGMTSEAIDQRDVIIQAGARVCRTHRDSTPICRELLKMDGRIHPKASTPSHQSPQGTGSKKQP